MSARCAAISRSRKVRTSRSRSTTATVLIAAANGLTKKSPSIRHRIGRRAGLSGLPSARGPKRAALRVVVMRSALHLGALEFDDDDRGHRVEDGALQGEEGASVLGLHLNRGLVGEAVGLRDPVLHRRNREWRARFVEERDVQLAGFRRDAPLNLLVDQLIAAHILESLRAGLAELLAEGGRARAVHGLAVGLQPAADRAQDVLADLRDDAFSGRTDVEQVVATLADNVDQLEGDLPRRFPVGVVLPESPGVVDGRRNFPRFT